MLLVSSVQAYMCTIANHPALQGSQELRVFLTYPTCLSECTVLAELCQWQQQQQHQQSQSNAAAILPL
jgi:hypothetical protein